MISLDAMELVFEKSEVIQEVEKASFTKETLHRVVTDLESRFWLVGEYPDPQILNQKFNLNFTILKEMLPQINKAMEKRELPEFDIYKRPKNELDPSFVVAVNSLVDISDKRTKSVKLKAVGLTTQKFNVLLNNPLNKAYLENRAEKAFNNVAPVAKTSLGKLVEIGDLQAIKYFHEFTGEHDPNREINNNLNKLISLFMEILIRHVPKDVVDVISKEFDTKLLELN